MLLSCTDASYFKLCPEKNERQFSRDPFRVIGIKMNHAVTKNIFCFTMYKL